MLQLIGIVLTILLIVYWVIAFSILYHLVRFGVGTPPKKIALTFIISSLVLSLITIFIYARLT